MSDENPVARLTKKRRTKISKPSVHHGPNELFIEAMKTVAARLKGQMYFYGGDAVMIIDAVAPVLNNFGDPTSGIKVSILIEERITDIFCLDWEDFRIKFKTKEEHDVSMAAINSIFGNEISADVNAKEFYALKKKEFEEKIPEIRADLVKRNSFFLRMKKKVIYKNFKTP